MFLGNGLCSTSGLERRLRKEKITLDTATDWNSMKNCSALRECVHCHSSTPAISYLIAYLRPLQTAGRQPL